MKVEINTTLKSADGVILAIDGTATTFYHGDKVLIKHNGGKAYRV